jgi:hypothetical protein
MARLLESYYSRGRDDQERGGDCALSRTTVRFRINRCPSTRSNNEIWKETLGHDNGRSPHYAMVTTIQWHSWVVVNDVWTAVYMVHVPDITRSSAPLRMTF